MNISSFLAKRISKIEGQTFSNIIIKVGIGSVAITVAVIILSFFILLGFKNTIKQKLFSQTSHIQVSKITLNRSFEETPMPNNLEYYADIQKVSGVDRVSRVAFKSVILKSNEEISGAVIKGVDERYDWADFDGNLVEGRHVMPDSLNEIVLSKRISSMLGIKVGQDLLAYFVQDPPRVRKLKVVGLYDTNVEELDKVYVVANLALVQRINLWEKGEFGHYEVWLKDVTKVDDAKAKLLDVLPTEYQVVKVTEILPHFFEWFSFLDRNIVLIIGLIILVAAFNMVSVLLIMIMERTPMVGLLKSLGASASQIRGVFLVNASKIIIKGLLWGNFSAILLGFIQWKFKIIKLDAENYYMSFVPIEWNLPVMLLVNLGVFSVVLLIALLPTLILRSISPVKALKYKD